MRELFDTELNLTDRPMDRASLLDAVKRADVLAPTITDRIDAEVLDAAPKLKVVSAYAVGVDNIDVAAATERGICVCNTPGVLTNATADLTWALILAAARRIVEEGPVARLFSEPQQAYTQALLAAVPRIARAASPACRRVWHSPSSASHWRRSLPAPPRSRRDSSMKPPIT